MDREQIKKTLDLFRADNGLLEIRIFSTVNKNDIYSGIFDNDEDLISEINKFDRDNYNIYFIFNELKNALNGMPQLNRMVRGAKAVNDKDIKYRRWLLVDVDPIRDGGVTDVASTDEELENARLVALAVRKYLREQGFKSPVVCRSGNGIHLLFKLNNVECTSESDEVFSNVLKYIALKFSDNKVDCDVKVANRARLTKFYSSVSRKGGNTKDRPHRKSEIVVIPPVLECTSMDVLNYLSQRYIKSQETDKPANNHNYYSSNYPKFDLDSFLSSNGLEVIKEAHLSNGDVKKVLKTCPFNSEHGKDSAIYVSPNGAIKFTCFHNSCASYAWRDLRLKFDPHAYDPKPQQYDNSQYPPRNYQPPKKEIKIKEELPELGKKWFRMKDIPKLDLNNIVSIKTGFHSLDRAIVGLNLGEVSLLSGSNSSGKSSWLNSLILNVINSGEKAALWSGELVPGVLKNWIQMVAAGKWNLLESKKNIGKFYTNPSVVERIDNWMDDKFFLYNNEYGSKWAQIFHDMKEMVDYGVRLLILDNLFTLDIDIFDGDRNNKQKELILQICEFAKKQNIHLILVCHPRKQVDFLRKDSISGTADLGNAASNIFIIHRVNMDFFKRGGEFFGKSGIEQFRDYGNVLEIAKNRAFGVVDFLCGMYYDIPSRRFMNEQNEEIHYGWEDPPKQEPIFDQHDYYSSFNGYQKEPIDDMPFAPAANNEEVPF